MLYSRRDFLRAALAAGVLPILPRLVRAASPIPKRLVAGTRVLEVNGRPAKVFGLTGPDGRPGIRLGPGERFPWTSHTHHRPLAWAASALDAGRLPMAADPTDRQRRGSSL